VLADDLLGFVALNPFGALVPGGNATVRIEKKNRVVFNVVDEQTKDFIALLQPGFRVFSRLCVGSDESQSRTPLLLQKTGRSVRRR
jgi:hypothetical protein